MLGRKMISPENNTIFGGIRRLITRSGGKITTLGACLVLSTLSLLCESQVAHAGQCFADGPRYQLESDTVEWRMKIRSSENCVRGVRFSYIWNATVNIITPPKFGQVTPIGPGFSYTAKSDFQGEDSFTVGVSGSRNKTSGFSTIRVVVSVVGAQEAILHSHAHFEAN
jgi:hypothetical protein